jgi:predicted RNA binding protein YcfA (HicA-like mRNA interferase family)
MQSAGGSHVRLQRRDGPGRVVVLVHANKPLKVGTIASILKMADLTEAQLKELL